MTAVVTSQFCYRPVVWICHSRAMSNKIVHHKINELCYRAEELFITKGSQHMRSYLRKITRLLFSPKPTITCYRSSHTEVFLRKGVLKICSKFTGEHPCRSVISYKLQSPPQLFNNYIFYYYNDNEKKLKNLKFKKLRFSIACTKSVIKCNKQRIA